MGSKTNKKQWNKETFIYLSLQTANSETKLDMQRILLLNYTIRVSVDKEHPLLLCNQVILYT